MSSEPRVSLGAMAVEHTPSCSALCARVLPDCALDVRCERSLPPTWIHVYDGRAAFSHVCVHPVAGPGLLSWCYLPWVRTLPGVTPGTSPAVPLGVSPGVSPGVSLGVLLRALQKWGWCVIG